MGYIASFYLGASFGFLFMVPMITGEYELQEHKFQKIFVWGLMALCWPFILVGVVGSLIKLSSEKTLTKEENFGIDRGNNK